MMTPEEIDWVKHAAGLKRMTLHEYMRRGVNMHLIKDGVDAVLLLENDNPLPEKVDGEKDDSESL